MEKPGTSQPFAITVVDEQTGRGVPLVELRTVNGVRLVTDSAGVVAFDEPGLMDKRVWFDVSSHGYEFPKDGFGFRGKALDVTPGGSVTLKIKRLNVAERLYRITGAGIYRDSVLLGRKPPLRQPLLNGLVFGSDSVLTAVYRGKVHWFWGDTNRPAYPLGNYNVPGATSLPPSAGGLDPDVGVDLTYFLDDKGFAKAVAPMPGAGPTWMVSLVVLPHGGRDRLFAAYIKVDQAMHVHARGVMVFDDAKQQFDRFAEIDVKAPAVPQGHVFRHTEYGVAHLYFAHPYPLTRVRATADDFAHAERYETYTCLTEGSRLDDPKIDRDASGKARYAWKRNTPAVGPEQQAKLVRAGQLKADEALLQLRDRDTGKSVQLHAGSVAWNDALRRWVLIATQFGGTSFLGEIWFTTAESPTGPWSPAVKVVTHEKYSFYNPMQHPEFTKRGGRDIYFEGTYTHTFSGNNDRTPRYDYNQIMYKLNLDDTRLRPK